MLIGLNNKLIIARTCYQHLAGELGMVVRNAMVKRKFVFVKGADVNMQFMLSDAGKTWTQKQEITDRMRIGTCMDYSHQHLHMSGPWAVDFCNFLFSQGCLEDGSEKREVVVTLKGQAFLYQELGIKWQIND